VKNKDFVLSKYVQYRCETRNFDAKIIEEIVRYSTERYMDTETNRKVVVGKHMKILALVPYEENENEIRPVTVHATSRQQIKFRLNTGRYIYE
jgi:hypothetical protein